MEEDDVNILPEELVFEMILTRLPVKSLLRFRCVSKSCRLLIDSDYFIVSHLAKFRTPCCQVFVLRGIHERKEKRNNEERLCTLFYSLGRHYYSFSQDDQYEDAIDIKLPIQESRPLIGYMNIIGSCNGILCIAGACEVFFCCFLWNPSTRETKVLRHPPYPPIDEHHHFYNYGFGFVKYSSSSLDYKVVASRADKTYVYSLRSDSWKQVQCSLVDEDVHLSIYGSTFFKTKIYWIRNHKLSKPYDIVCFDLVLENHRVIELPKDYHPDRPYSFTKLIVLGEQLLIHRKQYHSHRGESLWFLKSNNFTWHPLLTVPFHLLEKDEDEIDIWSQIKDMGLVEGGVGAMSEDISELLDMPNINIMAIDDMPRFAGVTIKWNESLVALH